MLRFITSTSPVAAKRYFTESLDRGDYYSQGREIPGIWGGKGAERLGLFGEVKQADFFALCENRQPKNGEALTPRLKDNRRVGEDIGMNPPKDVTALHVLTGDPAILEAVKLSARETMRQIEGQAQCRVRRDGAQFDRQTGNLVWGEFIHLTARPVGGVSDPHVHIHYFPFNATFDEAEMRWKAVQFGDIKRDAPYFEACFHARLAQRMRDAGYEVEPRGKYWGIAGMPMGIIEAFSRRTDEIEKLAKRLGVTDPNEKGKLGARTRESKSHNLAMDELRSIWESRISPGDLYAIRNLKDRGAEMDMAEPTRDPERALPAAAVQRREQRSWREVAPASDSRASGEARLPSTDRAWELGLDEPVAAVREIEVSREAERAVRFAIEHGFERQSVLREEQLIRAALWSGIGRISPEEAKAAVDRAELLRREVSGHTFLTTKAVFAEEARMLDFARDGRGRHPPFIANAHTFREERLNAEQRKAVEHVLGSHDRVTIVRGGAGTGKTSLMRETIDAIESAELKVFTLAPSVDASRGVLRSEGFRNAETVEKFLQNKEMRDQSRGQVLWVDEAGLLGTRTMVRLFDAAKQNDNRVVLSGDWRQHRSIERGEALRLLEQQAGVRPAEVTDVQRQRGLYRSAVAHLAAGRTELGFDGLEKLGAIRELEEGEAHRAIAWDYLNAKRSRKTALVVCPTHDEGRMVTDVIRKELRTHGLLSDKGREVEQLFSEGFSHAQKSQARFYEVGHVIRFHKNGRGFKAGQRTTVIGVDQLENVWVKGKLGPCILAKHEADRFDVFERRTIEVAPGDVLRLTRNGRTADGKHALTNGSVHVVKGFTSTGAILLSNRWEIPGGFGHFMHGYCVTSQASQGKTVDRVLLAQSARSFAATSAEQLYVSVSRGKESCTIYTDAKEELRSKVIECSDRLSATELLKDQERETFRMHARVQEQLRRTTEERIREERERSVALER